MKKDGSKRKNSPKSVEKNIEGSSAPTGKGAVREGGIKGRDASLLGVDVGP